MVDAARPEPAPPERPIPEPVIDGLATPGGAPAGVSTDGEPALLGASPGLPPTPAHLADPRALTILTTEHWGLLTARSLVYNEAFARAGMFLTFLSASLVALGFVYQGAGAGPDFPLIATAVLGLDLLVGLATMGRILTAGNEEYRALQGMNRLRHAYLEIVPTLEPYFTTSRYDDFAGVMAIYGAPAGHTGRIRPIAHGLTTTGGMVGVIVAAVAGALGATLAIAAGLGTRGALFAGLGCCAVMLVVIVQLATRVVMGQLRGEAVRFPSPPPER